MATATSRQNVPDPTAAPPGTQSALRIVVMGVSGCGKSTVGAQIAQALGLDFIEGDTLHPQQNVALMAAGIALTDADRAGWLAAIAVQLGQAQAAGRGLVLSCSALKRSYRDQLRSACPGLRWVHLHGEPGLLRERLQARKGHYMPSSLLDSQLATLEPPSADEAALCFDIMLPATRISAEALAQLAPTPEEPAMPAHFTQVTLFTDTDGRARFREQAIALTEGKPQAMLSPLMASAGMQLRQSPVGFRSDFHCTGDPQWVFILSGQMEISLQDGSARVFGPGQHFYSADTLPAGQTFDPSVHGHWSRQVGAEPLVTLFVRA